MEGLCEDTYQQRDDDLINDDAQAVVDIKREFLAVMEKAKQLSELNKKEADDMALGAIQWFDDLMAEKIWKLKSEGAVFNYP